MTETPGLDGVPAHLCGHTISQEVDLCWGRKRDAVQGNMARIFLLLVWAVTLIGDGHGAALAWERVGKVEGYVSAVAVAPGRRVIFADQTGGKRGKGRIAELRAGREVTLHSFRGYDGEDPKWLVTVGRTVYGMTSAGGRENRGVLFSVKSGRVRVLHHFSEEDGYARVLKRDGRVVYAVFDFGVFRLRGRQAEMSEYFLTGSVARFGEGYFVKERYLSSVSWLPDGGEPLLVGEIGQSWSPSLVWERRGRGLIGVGRYGGTYGEGAVREWIPGRNVEKSVVEFQSFNGGGPVAAAVSRRGTVYVGNGEGVWRVGKKPKQVGRVTAGILAFGGRELYAVERLVYGEATIWRAAVRD